MYSSLSHHKLKPYAKKLYLPSNCQEKPTVHQSIDQILMSNHSMLKVNLLFEL